jgi:hypothetical protein
MTQVVIIFIFLKVKDSKPEFAWVVQINLSSDSDSLLQ